MRRVFPSPKALAAMTFALASATSATGNPESGPAEVAVAYLEKIAERKVNLNVDGDTAISPHVSAAKRREISGIIERMAMDVAGGGLAAGETRVDGPLAAVIVLKSGNYDPTKVAAFAQALVLVDGKWLPAPVPASFENTTVMLDPGLRKAAAKLETWMLRERVLSHARLEEDLGSRMRKDIAGVITREQLAAMDAREMGEAFLKASTGRDRLRMLALLGGLSDPLPDDWGRRLRVAEEVAAGGARLSDVWRALTSPQVLRVILSQSDTGMQGAFEIGYIDPAAEVPRGEVPEVRTLEIRMSRDANGLLKLDPPPRMMTLRNEPGFRSGTGTSETDPESQMRFVELFRKANPASPQATPQALWERMREFLAADSPHGLLSLLALPDDDTAAANQALGRASRVWWQVAVGSGGRHPVRLAFHEVDDEAMVMMQLFAFREPDRTDLRALHFIRSDGGWLWSFTGRRKSEETVHPDLVTWRNEMEVNWRDRWMEPLLEPVARVGKIAPGKPVAAEDAVALARTMLDGIAAGDIAACLGRCAVLDDVEGRGRLLRNLGYEISTRLTEIDGAMVTRTGRHWTVVAYRRRGDVNPGMALLPLLTTPDGPRVLLELDLFVGDPQRDFLNNAALERLQGYATPDIHKDLDDLLADLNREFGAARK